MKKQTVQSNEASPRKNKIHVRLVFGYFCEREGAGRSRAPWTKHRTDKASNTPEHACLRLARNGAMRASRFGNEILASLCIVMQYRRSD